MHIKRDELTNTKDQKKDPKNQSKVKRLGVGVEGGRRKVGGVPSCIWMESLIQPISKRLGCTAVQGGREGGRTGCFGLTHTHQTHTHTHPHTHRIIASLEKGQVRAPGDWDVTKTRASPTPRTRADFLI